MSYENSSDTQETAAGNGQPPAAGRPDGDRADEHAPAGEVANPTTVIVRGETVRDQDSKTPSAESQQKDTTKTAPKAVSDAKLKVQSHLPSLDDDADVGVQKSHVVIRDGKADLAFTGTLVASAAPATAPKGHWQEYRIYETSAGKHVFSKVTRSIYLEDQDGFEAEVFDPAPDSMPSQLLRSARDLTRSRPLEWTDAALDFFGYDPLAKVLYRKISGKFEEHIA